MNTPISSETYKKQIEDAEEIAALNLAKYRKAQQQLEEADERSQAAESNMVRMRAGTPSTDRIAEITGIPWDPVGTAARSAQQDQEPQKVEEEIDGTQLSAEWAFSSLQKFGQEFLKKLRGKKMPNKLLEKVCKNILINMLFHFFSSMI